LAEDVCCVSSANFKFCQNFNLNCNNMIIYRFKEWSYFFKNKVQLPDVSIKIRIKRKHAKRTNFIYSSINKYETVLKIYVCTAATG